MYGVYAVIEVHIDCDPRIIDTAQVSSIVPDVHAECTHHVLSPLYQGQQRSTPTAQHATAYTPWRKPTSTVSAGSLPLVKPHLAVSVSHLVPHVGVRRRHVHLQAKRRGPFLQPALGHLTEQLQACLLYTSPSPRD